MEQGTNSWLLWRKNKIGSSDSSSIMGCNPYKTAYNLYCEKKDPDYKGYISDAMLRGTELEPFAREWYIKTTGNFVVPCIHIHPIYENIHASFDGMDFEEKIGAEIKCPGTNTLKDIERYGIPEHYICQCQHQMFVADLDSIDLVIYDGIRGTIHCIQRDEKYILKLLDKILEFLECLKTNTPPKDNDCVIRDDEEWESETRWYKDLLEKKALIDEQIESSREKLINMASGRNTKGCGITLTQVDSEGRIDYKSIPILKGMDLTQYRKPSSKSWRITLNEKPPLKEQG